jgi:CDP-diacylglycerol--glycerol-3-phosphate 3-phosphatidyltransferase
MASIYDLKPRFQGLLRPLVQRLAASGITPNQVTLAAFGLSAAEGLLILLFPASAWPLLLLPLALLLRMALNAIDGMLAREHEMESALGAILNELGDVLSDGAIYLPLAYVPGVPAALVVVAVVLAVIGEMAGLVGGALGGGRRYDGPMGKSDRAFVFGAVGLLLGLGVEPGIWLDALLGIVVLLLLVTIVNRARRALDQAAR